MKVEGISTIYESKIKINWYQGSKIAHKWHCRLDEAFILMAQNKNFRTPDCREEVSTGCCYVLAAALAINPIYGKRWQTIGKNILLKLNKSI